MGCAAVERRLRSHGIRPSSGEGVDRGDALVVVDDQVDLKRDGLFWTVARRRARTQPPAAVPSPRDGLRRRSHGVAPFSHRSAGMDIITWLIVGLIAGTLASIVARGTYGIIGDIVLGIVGAFIGSWGFRELGWHAPFPGLAGVIAVAFVGAVVLLLAIRLVARRAPRQ